MSRLLSLPIASLKAIRSDRTEKKITTNQVPIDGEPKTPFTFELPPPTTNHIYPRPKLLKPSQYRGSKPKKSLHQLAHSACQASCSMVLKRSIPSTGMNLLITDPAVVDLLLICVSAVSQHYSRRRFLALDLLPKCPIKENKERMAEIVDDMSALSTIYDGRILSVAMDASSMENLAPDGAASPSSLGSTSTSMSTPTTPSATSVLTTLDPTHRALLIYILSSPFAHLSTIIPTTHPHLTFPSLTNYSITPFLITKQPRNKESLFRYHTSQPTCSSIPVFHGTHPSRLPLILSHGLRNMSGTRYQAHGRAMGRGIYLASDHYTSINYCNSVRPWKGSRWSSAAVLEAIPTGTSCYSSHSGTVQVLLACELAVQEVDKEKGIFVEADEGKVIVRFVFLIQDGQPGDEFNKDVGRAMEVLREMRGV